MRDRLLMDLVPGDGHATLSKNVTVLSVGFLHGPVEGVAGGEESVDGLKDLSAVSG